VTNRAARTLDLPSGATPFRSRDGQLCTAVRIAGATCQALIDTGSKGHVVDPRISKRFPRVGKSVLRGVLGSVPTVRVQLPAVTFLGHRFTGLTAKVGPPTRRSNPAWDLLLGTDVLLWRPLTLDFRRRVACFEAGTLATEPEEVFRLRYHRGRPFLTVKLGRKTLRATLDIGCSSCLLNSRVRGIRACVVKTDVAVDVAGRRSRWTSYRGPALDLGRGAMGKSRFVRASLAPAEKGLGQPVDFVVGSNVLRERGGVWTISRIPGELRWSSGVS